jgi:hypothetical protein
VIDRHCAENGRDPAEIVRSVQLRVSYDEPGATREEAQAFVDAGARHVLLMLSPPYPEGIVRRLVEEIVEPVQKQDR